MKKKITIEKKQETNLEPDSAEYRIAVMQLHRLEQIAMERLFTKEEAAIYDVLCRNIKLAKGDPTIIKGEYTKEEYIDSKELLDFVKSEIANERKDERSEKTKDAKKPSKVD